MQTLWYKHLFDKSFNASFLFMNLGMEGGDAEKQNSDTKYLQTLGTNLIYTPSHWMVGGMFYYQFGKTKSWTGCFRFFMGGKRRLSNRSAMEDRCR